MTRIGRRLIEDFLLPALDDGRYGDLLKWVDKEKRMFSIRWSHKNAAKWTDLDTAVFQDWDKLKGRHKPDSKGYHMQAKQRFRAALYKLNTVEKLESPDKYTKCYRLCLNGHKKNDIKKRKENQTAIRTPVICKNTTGKGTELVGGDQFEESNGSSSTSSPPYHIKTEDSDQNEDKVNFDEKDYEEYMHAIKRQRKQSSPHHYPQHTIKTTCQTILRESPQQNFVRKTHLQHAVVPDYKTARPSTVEYCSTLQNNRTVVHNVKCPPVGNCQRVESPKVFCVKTYNDSTNLNEMEICTAEFLVSLSRKQLMQFKKEDDEDKKEHNALNLSLNKNGYIFR